MVDTENEVPAQPLPNVVLPPGVDEEAYVRIRARMRIAVLSVWGNDRVVAGMDPWAIVDEAWASMVEQGFRAKGPFEPFALRVARNKALDAIKRPEFRQVAWSLDAAGSAFEGTGGRALADALPSSPGAEVLYLDRTEDVERMRSLHLVEEAIFTVLSRTESRVFQAVHVNGRSRAAAGRELSPPITGQRVGQIAAVALKKIKRFVMNANAGRELP